MELLLRRGKSTSISTIGELFINGTFFCYTLEDPVRPFKIPKITAIDAGRYKVVLTMSARFKKILPLLIAVLNFVGVRMHNGNTAEDTEGCILVGMERAADFIGHSMKALDLLLQMMEVAIEQGQEIWITIEDFDGRIA